MGKQPGLASNQTRCFMITLTVSLSRRNAGIWGSIGAPQYNAPCPAAQNELASLHNSCAMLHTLMSQSAITHLAQVMYRPMVPPALSVLNG